MTPDWDVEDILDNEETGRKVSFFDPGKTLLDFLSDRYGVTKEVETEEGKKVVKKLPFLKAPLSSLRKSGELKDVLRDINSYLNATGQGAYQLGESKFKIDIMKEGEPVASVPTTNHPAKHQPDDWKVQSRGEVQKREYYKIKHLWAVLGQYADLKKARITSD